MLGWPESTGRVIPVTGARGTGNVVSLEARFGAIAEQTIGIGVRGISAEAVAHEAATAMVQYLNSDAVVGKRLADQLQLPLALMGQGQIKMPLPSNHFKTNARVIAAFTGKSFTIESQGNRTILATVSTTAADT
ncbi:MAG: RNA 3'-terminal phosphate cyclase [Cyanobacteria bacterium J06642_11]